MKMLKTVLSIVICLFVLSMAAYAETQNRFLVLTIDNKIINPIVTDYICSGIDEAQKNHDQGVIIQMDTPGGLLESTRAIVKKILNADIPVIVYIAPSGSRAGSAGVFITMAAHLAAMAPSTNIGAARPVTIGFQKEDNRSLKEAIENLTQALKSEKTKTGKKQTKGKEETAQTQKKKDSDSIMEDKILNDTLAWISSIAKTRGRNAEWAKEAVLESVSVTDKEALDKKIINLIADNINDLLEKIDGLTIPVTSQRTITFKTKEAVLAYKDMNTQQNILNTIIHPNIAYILMLIGFLGLFIEITHPGTIFPGILGLICLIVAFYAFAMLPVNFAGFILIGLAIIFFIAEALTPTFGFFTIAGIISMLIGSLMLINSPFPAMRVSLNVILPFIVSMGAIVIFLTANVIKSHRRKVKTGPEALVDQIAVAQMDINAGGEGLVFVAGEIWTAINQSQERIANGEKIKVLGVDKVKLLVSKYEA